MNYPIGEVRQDHAHMRTKASFYSNDYAEQFKIGLAEFDAALADHDAELIEGLIRRMEEDVEPQARAGSWKSFTGIRDWLRAEADRVRLSPDSRQGETDD